MVEKAIWLWGRRLRYTGSSRMVLETKDFQFSVSLWKIAPPIYEMTQKIFDKMSVLCVHQGDEECKKISLPKRQ